jgi:hypothetical protein
MAGRSFIMNQNIVPPTIDHTYVYRMLKTNFGESYVGFYLFINEGFWHEGYANAERFLLV